MTPGRRHRVANYHRQRNRAGAFVHAAHATRAMPLQDALSIYSRYLARVCEAKGMTMRSVLLQLARPGEPVKDRTWRAAAYARQLAIYLAHVVGEVPQAQLGSITGLATSSVSRACAAIEDTRECGDYDALIDMIAVEMGAP